MKRIVLLLLLVAITPVFIAGSCNKRCGEDTVCTDMFAIVTVQITDSNGQPVSLDEVYTKRALTSEVIRITQSMEAGYYIVLDDNYQKKLAQSSDNFQFIGMKNGQKVVDEVYSISADCCHINKKTGKDTVKL